MTELKEESKTATINRPFLPFKESAHYLGIAEQTLYQYVHKKKIPYLKVNGQKLYFKIIDLENFVMNATYIKSDAQIDQEKLEETK